MPRFKNLGDEASKAPFLRGYGYQGRAMRTGWEMGNMTPGFGKDLKNALRKPGPWMFALSGFGECLPSEDNQVTLDETKVDRFGIPQVKVSFAFDDNAQKMREDAAGEAAAMIEASGGVVLMKMAEMSPGGDGIHEMGTARIVMPGRRC